MDKFDTTCRTCNAIRSNLVNLFSNSPIHDSMNLYEILCLVCPSLSIENNDKLPQKICFFCSKQLEIAYKFQLQCQKSNEELWKLVKDSLPKEQSPQAQEEYEHLLENEQDETQDDMLFPEEVFESKSEVDDCPEFLEDDVEELEMILVAESEPAPVEETSAPNDEIIGASFDCNLCAKKYLTSNGILMHMKLAHKNHKPIQTESFPCRHCYRILESKEQRKEHCLLEHKNLSKTELTCHICQKSFQGKNKLDHHVLYHDKSIFRCIVKDCNRTFSIKYKVTDHLKRFHGIILTASQSKALKPISKSAP